MIILTQSVKKALKACAQKIFIFFIFLLQKMEIISNKIITTRTKIMTIVKKFKEKLDLHNNEITASFKKIN